VSVPKAHTLGEVDRPRQSSLFGITYNGDEDPQHDFIIQRIEKLDRGASVTDIRNAVGYLQGLQASGLGNILDPVIPPSVRSECDLALDMVVDGTRDADFSRLGQSLEARCDVYAVAQDVAVLDDDVTRLIPMRNWMRRPSTSVASRSATPFWIATAHSTASTHLRTRPARRRPSA
jgi:hypothetical protein